MIFTHIFIYGCDSICGNSVNTMCEAIAPILEELTEGKVRLKILSNLAR